MGFLEPQSIEPSAVGKRGEATPRGSGRGEVTPERLLFCTSQRDL